jgi:hypothetical protein
MGFCGPTTLEATDSDQHQIYLTWLCCAYRLSQPPDALFRPKPFPPCFMRVTPLSFYFQRFSLSGSEERLTTFLPFMPFPATNPDLANQTVHRSAAAPRDCAPGKSVTTSPVLPEKRRPILS